MDSAVAALLGAIIGALSGVVGVLMTNWLQFRAEHQRWIRDQKSKAYSDALQYLYRFRNKRSRVLGDGRAVLNIEHQKEWFDDYIATMEAIGRLAIFANQEFQFSLEKHAVQLRTAFELVLTESNNDKNEIFNIANFIDLTESLEDEVIRAAQRDLNLKQHKSRR